MRTSERDPARSTRRDPTVTDVVVRRLAQLGLTWASRWILMGLFLLVALGLFAVWVLLLVVLAWVGGLLGLTAGDRATPFVLGAMVVSGLILFRPMRWAARNLLRAERAMDATIERVEGATALGPAATGAAPHATTPEELRALDTRLAQRPATSTPRERFFEED